MTEPTFQQRVLYTKDGTKTGNAILVREIHPEDLKDIPCLNTYLADTGQKLYWVETDFGNSMRLSTNEINEQYLYGPEQNYYEWYHTRQALIDGDDD